MSDYGLSVTVADLDEAESAYERDVLPFVRPFTAALVESLPAGPFGSVLDHGAGTGEALLAVVGAVAVAESVALDPNPAMCRRLRATLRDQRTVVIETTLRDYLRRPPDAAFDLIVSQLSLSFVPEPAAEL